MAEFPPKWLNKAWIWLKRRLLWIGIAIVIIIGLLIIFP